MWILKFFSNLVKSNVITGERGTQSSDTMQVNEVRIVCTLSDSSIDFVQAKKASALNSSANAVKSNVITGERGTQAIDMTTENQAKAQAQNDSVRNCVFSRNCALFLKNPLLVGCQSQYYYWRKEQLWSCLKEKERPQSNHSE